MLPTVYGAPHSRVAPQRFPIRLAAVPGPVRLLLGVRPDTGMILVGDGMLDVRFGRWRICTPLPNLAAIETGSGCGSASPLFGIGLSIADRGLALGVDPAVCARFHQPVHLLPGGPGHQWLAVAVESPERLAGALRGRCANLWTTASAPGPR